MLRPHTAYSAYGVKKYFETADYYSQGNETVGLWGGKLAEELGPDRPGDEGRLRPAVRQHQPGDRRTTTLRMNEHRRVGDDFVFSLLKDVGAFIMLLPPAERDAMLAMVERRVDQVMGMIEADVETRVRKDGAFYNRPGDGLVYAGYLHTTSRPVARSKAADDNLLSSTILSANGTIRPIRIRTGICLLSTRPAIRWKTRSRRRTSPTSTATGRSTKRCSTRWWRGISPGWACRSSGVRRQVGHGRAAIDGGDVLQADQRNRGRSEAAQYHRCRRQGEAGGDDTLEERQGDDARASCGRRGRPSSPTRNARRWRRSTGGKPQAERK